MLSSIPASGAAASGIILFIGHLAQLYVSGLWTYPSSSSLPDDDGGKLQFCSIIVYVSFCALGFRFLNDLKGLGVMERLDLGIRSMVINTCSVFTSEERIKALDSKLINISINYRIGSTRFIYSIFYTLIMIFLMISVLLASISTRDQNSSSSYINILGKNLYNSQVDFSLWIGLFVGWIDLFANIKKESQNSNSSKNTNEISPFCGIQKFRAIGVESIKYTTYAITITQVLLISVSYEKKIIFSMSDSIVICIFTSIYATLLRIASFYFQNRASIITDRYSINSTSKSLKSRESTSSHPSSSSSSSTLFSSYLDWFYNRYVRIESPIDPPRSSPFLIFLFKALFISLILESFLILTTAKRLFGHASLILCGGSLILYLVIKIFYSSQ